MTDEFRSAVAMLAQCIDAGKPVWDAWAQVRAAFPGMTSADFDRALSEIRKADFARGTAKRDVPVLIYNGLPIRDRAERLNLTDMWRASGSPSGRAPADWGALSSAKEFIAHIEATLDAGKSGIQTTKGGRGIGGATWAHWQIGLAYAKYLSPEFHAWCNSVVRAHMEGAPEVANIDLGAIGGVVKGVVNKAIAAAINELVPVAVEAQLMKDPRIAVGEYVPALKVCTDNGVPARRRRGFALSVSHRLRAFCNERGITCRRDVWRGVWVFPVAAVAQWLEKEGGASFVKDHCNKLAGQGLLHFPKGGKRGQ